ncbi:MAG: hypothetical protein U0T81_14350 [Saprospiraceae bacterium]
MFGWETQDMGSRQGARAIEPYVCFGVFEDSETINGCAFSAHALIRGCLS